MIIYGAKLSSVPAVARVIPPPLHPSLSPLPSQLSRQDKYLSPTDGVVDVGAINLLMPGLMSGDATPSSAPAVIRGICDETGAPKRTAKNALDHTDREHVPNHIAYLSFTYA